ncbi:glycosyl hydrolase family 18 protein [Flavobacterium pectinovorum]|uniref:glycosyl hydrolase family 18 protein n=1 Tax=Flavobacterium pectinovorum TaxID=29533 RepID=UPI00265F2CE1|nr:glycosyl hydrolase family 18 protein [Flavobacterium pectinovorum]WKL50499.1 glycosyl hydrolase family 18 protein [Flavobacterium pectinovorum]
MRFIYIIIIVFFSLFTCTICFAQEKNNAPVIKKNVSIEIPTDTAKVKKTLLKKIKDAFKFRTNFRKGEEERIIAIINRLQKPDQPRDTTINNTYVTNNNVPISTIQKQIDSLFLDFTTSVDSTKISNIDINNLIDKLLPMVQKKIDLEKEEEKRQAKIKQIHNLLQYPLGTFQTVRVNKIPVKIIFKKVVRNTEVYGFHPYWMNKFYLNYNYKVLNTLIYYGYELDGKTGGYKTLNGWDTADVVTKAKKEGCKVVLCIFDKNQKSLDDFLKNKDSQLRLINDTKFLLKEKNADGINIFFENFGDDNRYNFTEFISLFYKSLKAENSLYQLTVTLPVFDKYHNYDVGELEPYVDRFIIDFSKKNNYGPITPLKGSDYSLDAGIDRYLNKNIPPKKIVACLTYNGILWKYKSKKSEFKFYNTIVKDYLSEYNPLYDKNNGAYIDIIKNKKDTISQLWFDDVQTICEKYDFILNKGIGGIGIWGLGSDDGRPELWNALIDKTMYINVKTKILKPPVKEGMMASWKRRLIQEIELYKKLFNHPCDFTKDDSKKMFSDNLFIRITEILFVIILLIVLFCLKQKKQLGDDWTKSKLYYGILTFLSVFLAICIVLCLFLNPGFSGFGLSSSGKCETTFITVLKILGGGIIIGSLAMKFLIFPLIKPKEVP